MAFHPNPLSLMFLTGVIESRPDAAAWRAQYIGNTLMPDREVGGYKLTWDVIQSENNLAGIYAINGRPIPGSDMLFEQRFAEVKNIMSGRTLHPDDVSVLREPGEIAVSRTGKALLQAAQNKLRRLAGEIDNEVDAQKEYMIMRALQGSIVWPPVDATGVAITPKMPQWGNVSMTINYPLRAAFVQNVTTLVGYNSRAGGGVAWTTPATSNPILDLEVIAELIIETTGLDAHQATIIMSGEILSYLAFNDNILSWIKGTEQGVRYIAPEDLKNFIKTKIGYDIQVYNARWTYRSGVDSATGPTVTSVPFLSRGKVLIVPKGVKPGYFAMAPSPDGKYQPGKYQWMTVETEPPWETRIGEGLVGFPIPEYFDQVFILDVLN